MNYKSDIIVWSPQGDDEGFKDILSALERAAKDEVVRAKLEEIAAANNLPFFNLRMGTMGEGLGEGRRVVMVDIDAECIAHSYDLKLEISDAIEQALDTPEWVWVVLGSAPERGIPKSPAEAATIPVYKNCGLGSLQLIYDSRRAVVDLMVE